MNMIKTFSIITAIFWTLTVIYPPIFIGVAVINTFITLELIIKNNI